MACALTRFFVDGQILGSLEDSELALVGNVPELGCWVPESAAGMEFDSERQRWHCVLVLPVTQLDAEPIQLKVIERTTTTSSHSVLRWFGRDSDQENLRVIVSSQGAEVLDHSLLRAVRSSICFSPEIPGLETDALCLPKRRYHKEHAQACQRLLSAIGDWEQEQQAMTYARSVRYFAGVGWLRLKTARHELMRGQRQPRWLMEEEDDEDSEKEEEAEEKALDESGQEELQVGDCVHHRSNPFLGSGCILEISGPEARVQFPCRPEWAGLLSLLQKGTCKADMPHRTLLQEIAASTSRIPSRQGEGLLLDHVQDERGWKMKSDEKSRKELDEQHDEETAEEVMGEKQDAEKKDEKADQPDGHPSQEEEPQEDKQEKEDEEEEDEEAHEADGEPNLEEQPKERPCNDELMARVSQLEARLGALETETKALRRQVHSAEKAAVQLGCFSWLLGLLRVSPPRHRLSVGW